jgi:hypothetical protein
MAANLIAASCFAWRASQIRMQRVRQNNPTGKSPKVCPAPFAKKKNFCFSELQIELYD